IRQGLRVPILKNLPKTTDLWNYPAATSLTPARDAIMVSYLFVAASLVMGQAPGVEESSPPDNFASAIAGTQVHDQPQLPGESGAEPSGAVQAAPTIVVSYPASPAQTASPASTAPSASSESSKEPKRRALPSPFDSPPFPGSEYQG